MNPRIAAFGAASLLFAAGAGLLVFDAASGRSTLASTWSADAMLVVAAAAIVWIAADLEIEPAMPLLLAAVAVMATGITLELSILAWTGNRALEFVCGLVLSTAASLLLLDRFADPQLPATERERRALRRSAWMMSGLPAVFTLNTLIALLPHHHPVDPGTQRLLDVEFAGYAMAIGWTCVSAILLFRRSQPGPRGGGSALPG